jgi:glycosyltransferase involved in cell wall biosynthesis
MGVEVLTSKNPNNIGGQERWLQDIKLAVKDLPYDFSLITDDISMYRADLTKPHLYYLTTPRRAFYDMYKNPLVLPLRYIDQHKVRQVKNIACISKTVQERIKQYYNRSSDVIYPCVHCEEYTHSPSSGYWLSVQRVDKWKRVDMQVEAFRQLKDERLIIVGPISRGHHFNLPKNVEMYGAVSRDHLKSFYAHCEGVICTSINEDFGIVPLEAMASGKPVVAVNEGGYRETVVDGITGRLVNDIKDGIENCPQLPEMCLEQAKKFSYEIFKLRLERKIFNCIE